MKTALDSLFRGVTHYPNLPPGFYEKAARAEKLGRVTSPTPLPTTQKKSE